MLKAVLFDMDDTLLDINLSAFIAVYLRDMAQLLGDVGRKNHFAAFAALTGIMLDLNNQRAPPTMTIAPTAPILKTPYANARA